MLAGRLTPDEFGERLGSAHTSRTRADLDAVMIDLPITLESQQRLSEPEAHG